MGELRRSRLGFGAWQFRDLDVVARQFEQVRANHLLIDVFPVQGAVFAGAVPVEQPGRARGLGLVDAAPDRVAAALGAGQGHVQQAHALGLGLGQGLAYAPRQLLSAQVQEQPAFVDQGPVLGASGPAKDEGAEDHRVLEPLAFMDGHDLDRIAVRVQAELGFLGAVGAEPPGEPGQQCVHGRARLAFLAVEQLQAVQDVGHAPFAVRQGDKAPSHIEVCEESARGGHDAPAVPQFAAGEEAFEPRLEFIAVLVDEREIRGRQADHGRGKGRAQGRRALAFGHAAQHGQEFRRLGAGKDRRGVGHDARDAKRAKGLVDGLALGVGFDQDGDVPWQERRVADADVPPCRPPQQAADLGGHGPADARRKRPLGQGLVLAFDLPEDHGRGCVPVFAEAVPLLVRGAHGLVADFRVQEGPWIVRSEKQPVHGGDELRRGAVVDAQCHAALAAVGRVQIGVQVRAPEGIDGLLGVADEEQAVLPVAGGEEGAEDVVLQAVGVLELVDEGRAVLGPCCRDQLGAGQGGVHAAQQVVETQHVATSLEVVQARRHARKERMAQMDHEGSQRLPQGFYKVQDFLDLVEQRVLRGGEGLFGHAPHVRRSQFAEGLELLLGIESRVVQEVARPFQTLIQLLRRELTGVEIVRPGQKERSNLSFHYWPGRLQPFAGLPHGPVKGCWVRRGAVRHDADALGQEGQAGQFRELVRGQLLAHFRAGQTVKGQDATAPEIHADLAAQVREVRFELRVEEGRALEAVAPEHALAEAVDGEDLGQVEVAQGEFQAAGGVGAAKAGEEVQFQFFVGLQFTGQHPGHVGQPFADAPAQFLGSRVREGHHQDLVYGQVLLQQQAHEEAGQGVGLAGAGAGLDEGRAVQGRGAKVHGLHHWAPPSMGP
ncbi:hypothetical protein DSECCO2_385710 [anaerobic digester metagenome]